MNDQRLDTFSKIILATSAINQMANAVNMVLVDYRFVGDNPIMKMRSESHEEALQNTLSKLSEAMEEIADYMNGCDMVSSIDAQMTDAACKIILLGRDSVEGYGVEPVQ